MAKQTRLDDISKKRYKKNIILILFGIIVIIVIFILFGVPLLINFSLMVLNLKGNSESEGTVNETTYIAPPILNPLQDATNKAHITISGTTLAGQSVKLYLNGKYVKQTNVNNKNSFVFENILLDEGDNAIKAKVTSSAGDDSDYSQVMHIIYKNKPPLLEINTPHDKQIYTNSGNQIKIEGKTDPDVRVTVNNYWALIDDKGNFSYLFNFQKGENKIKVIATDNAGNKTEKELTIIKE